MRPVQGFQGVSSRQWNTASAVWRALVQGANFCKRSDVSLGAAYGLEVVSVAFPLGSAA